MLEPVCSGAVSPDRALHLPTFSHFVIVKRTSLFLSLSLSLSRSLARSAGVEIPPCSHPKCAPVSEGAGVGVGGCVRGRGCTRDRVTVGYRPSNVTPTRP
jgi:hypothetical protein